MDTKEFLLWILGTWDVHVRLLGVGSKVERERFVFQITGSNESGEVVNGDSIVGKTNNTTHLRNVESGS